MCSRARNAARRYPRNLPALQWGGRFDAPPDRALLAFGSSLEDDLVLAPFDVQCSRAHVVALARGGIIDASAAAALDGALDAVASEIAAGTFASAARASGAEDVHGAIDARVRERAGSAGESLHAGRSRNDQVATTLALYVVERASGGASLARTIGTLLIERARAELAAQTLLGATTHWQPAQPVLLAFWLAAAAEPFVRAAERFARVARDAKRWSPLGSGALAGSSLALDREAAAAVLGFEAPSRNALDAIGTRDAALDLAHAMVRVCVDASRIAEELIIWCTPAFGYARLSDAASTGSSLMPQKRNPDPLELVRGTASYVNGLFNAALGTLCGLGLSYHRDLQVTKKACIGAIEAGQRSLEAFARALNAVQFDRARMTAVAGNGFTIATDVADALIRSGATARRAHELVGAAVLTAEREGRSLEQRDLESIAAAASIAVPDAPLDAAASVRAKTTVGSTSPAAVAATLDAIAADLEKLAA